jgi:hypothetical protein
MIKLWMRNAWGMVINPFIGVYIYMSIGRIPIMGWRTIPDMTIFSPWHVIFEIVFFFTFI